MGTQGACHSLPGFLREPQKVGRLPPSHKAACSLQWVKEEETPCRCKGLLSQSKGAADPSEGRREQGLDGQWCVPGPLLECPAGAPSCTPPLPSEVPPSLTAGWFWTRLPSELFCSILSFLLPFMGNWNEVGISGLNWVPPFKDLFLCNNDKWGLIISCLVHELLVHSMTLSLSLPVYKMAKLVVNNNPITIAVATLFFLILSHVTGKACVYSRSGFHKCLKWSSTHHFLTGVDKNVTIIPSIYSQEYSVGPLVENTFWAP